MAVYHDIHANRYVATDRTPGEVEADHHMNVAARVIYLVGGTIIALLALRFLLALFGANMASGFANFIYDVTYPFAAPFFGLFNYNPVIDKSRFEIGTLVAMVVYALVTELIARLVTVANHHDEA